MRGLIVVTIVLSPEEMREIIAIIFCDFQEKVISREIIAWKHDRVLIGTLSIYMHRLIIAGTRRFNLIGKDQKNRSAFAAPSPIRAWNIKNVYWASCVISNVQRENRNANRYLSLSGRVCGRWNVRNKCRWTVANTAAISNIRDVAAPFLQSVTDFLINLGFLSPWEKFMQTDNYRIASLVANII